jgi:1-phosphofructokinase family hexose kinase
VILSIGLSPAWQQILLYDAIHPGEVNRARESHWCASGKVLNVGRAVHSLAPSPNHLTICPLGGPAGRAIEDEFRSDGIPLTILPVPVPTRVCTTLIETNTNRFTELVENSRPIAPTVLTDFEQLVASRRHAMTDLRCVVVSGSLPTLEGGASPTDCVARMLRDVGAPSVLDIRGPELLAALPLRPRLVKPNREELSATVRRKLDSDADLLAAMRDLVEQGAESVLVTQGAGPAFFVTRDSQLQFTPPRVDVVNPIGCGDCVAAGIAVGIAEGLPLAESVRLGMAAAAENATMLLPARLNRAKVNSRVESVIVSNLP